MAYTAAVITVSDSCSRGENTDTSGPRITRMLKAEGYDVTYASLVPDGDEHFTVRQSARGVISSQVEELTLRIGSRINRTVEPWAPSGFGRRCVYDRDIAMVQSATEVFCFFAPGRLMARPQQ